ncbi:Leucyl-tRNA synthetase [Paramicrosporidium saccamoebae]|uniref:leucine--tRNA ligase n=1 Tax=Paramicrosporidium saccamoebae TaxID=1246581 RepID=A0A2H9TGP4_9FUNG|nr:Leucyl-tRNA synthetase [Paramicrosporidium saccamoebae]
MRFSKCAWFSTVKRCISPQYILEMEGKWKGRWSMRPEEYHVNATAAKKYILAMFPYPSGNLHIGHVRVYAISDALSRYQRLLGAPVLHPIGWDAFGLPAENAAIERAIPPAEWTRANIKQMRSQLDSLSLRFDWDHAVTTCEPEYYRWTQWLFLRLMKKGLVERREAEVNWDPVDETVLANEQVDSNGCSWRSGAKVEKRMLRQWFLKITKYQDDLLKGLEGLEWPRAVKDMQRHWIVASGEYRFTIEGGSLVVALKRSDDWRLAESILIDPKHPNRAIGSIINPATSQPIPVVVSTESLKDPMVAQVVLGKKQAKLNPLPAQPPPEFVITEYRLRDWLISRQRYWGTPIPIIHCATCGVTMHLDVPMLGKGSPLAQHPSWSAPCPSWYFARHVDPQNDKMPADPSKLRQWLPVDAYIGGIEHAILHLLYARFMTRFMAEELGFEQAEPFAGLITQGLVEGKTYQCPATGRYLKPEELRQEGKKVIITETGALPLETWDKMSKSKYNGVDPVGLVSQYGADVLRLCVMFKAPPEVALQWNTRDIAGPQRWILRLLTLAGKIMDRSDNAAIGCPRSEASLVASMEYAYDPARHRLNLAVSNLMTLSNDIEKSLDASPTTLRTAMKALALDNVMRRILAGLSDFLAWHRLVPLFIKDRDLLVLFLRFLFLNGVLYLGTVSLLLSLLTRHPTNFFRLVVLLLWFLPIYPLCFMLNERLYTLLAAHLHPSDHHARPAEQLYRAIFLGIHLALIYGLPAISSKLYVLTVPMGAWVYALYACEYYWHATFSVRVARIEDNALYFLGFGLMPALAMALFRPLVGLGVSSLAFGMAVLMAFFVPIRPSNGLRVPIFKATGLIADTAIRLFFRK